MKKQEQESLPPRPISRSDVVAYFGKPESGFRDRLFVIIETWEGAQNRDEAEEAGKRESGPDLEWKR